MENTKTYIITIVQRKAEGSFTIMMNKRTKKKQIDCCRMNKEYNNYDL